MFLFLYVIFIIHNYNFQIILGSVTIARSKLETVEEIKKRIEEALLYIPKYRNPCLYSLMKYSECTLTMYFDAELRYGL